MCSTFYIIYKECVVIRQIQLQKYLQDGWNLLDIVSIAANFVYIGSVLKYSDHSKGLEEAAFVNVLASGCIFLMYAKFFYWMRLFKPFSAFIRMISEILADIKVFFIVLLISLLAFANIIFILNINRNEDMNCTYLDEKTEKMTSCDSIYDGIFGNGGLDSTVHAYLLGLGEFQVDNYAHTNQGPIWFFFLVATILVQLLFMNLLIAIMGSSYGRVSEIIDQSTLKELCIMMHDHIWILNVAELHK